MEGTTKPTIHETIDAFCAARKAIVDHFGHVEDWRLFPIVDLRGHEWFLMGGNTETGEGSRLIHAMKDTITVEDAERGNFADNGVYTYCHLDRWVHRVGGLVMVLIDTHADGNVYNAILSEDREVKSSSVRALVAELW